MREIVIIFMLLGVACSFHLGGRLTEANLRRSLIVCSSINEDGRKIYEAAAKGDVVKLNNLIKEVKGDRNAINWRFLEVRI